MKKTLYKIIRSLDKADLICGYKYYKVNYIFENIFTKDVKGEYNQIYKNLLSKKMKIIVTLKYFIYY